MAFLIFALSLILLVAAVAAGYMSLDLLPTPIGVLYSLAGAFSACLAAVVLALGVLVRRIDSLTRIVRKQAAAAGPGAHSEAVHVEPDFFQGEPPSPATEADVEPPASLEETEDPINMNRAGHLPTLGEVEHTIETPEAPPSLIGRYSAGGANYMIFADGSIEAETAEGAFKFASMGDFKRFLADRKEGKA